MREQGRSERKVTGIGREREKKEREVICFYVNQKLVKINIMTQMK